MPTAVTSPENSVTGDRVGRKSGISLSRWTTAIAGALLLLHGMLAWRGRAFGINTGNDDAAYLLLARSLRDFSYRDSHLLGSPIHSQYPPGFPAFLAVLSLPFGERFDLFLAAIVLCSVAALALLYDTIRRLCGSTVALTVLALCAVNPALVQYAGSLVSETPYIFFTVLTAWIVTREPRDAGVAGERSLRWPAFAIVAAVGAALTRAIGITVLGALFLYWLLERRYRRVVAFAVTVGLTAGSWLLWTVFAPTKIVGRSYIADATFGGAGQQNLIEMLITRVTSNVPVYLSASIPTILPQPTIEGTIVDNLVGAIVLFGLGAIGAWVLWRRARFVVLYLAVYAALLAVWPWKLTRFLVPVVPFILWTGIAGAISLSAKRRWLRPVPFIVAGAIFLTAFTRDYSSLMVAARCDRHAPMTSAGCYTEVQRAFFEAMNFIRESTPDTAVFLTVKEGTVGYLTARRALAQEAVDARDPVAMLRNLRERGVEFIVLTPLRQSQAQHVPALLQVCGDLETVREFTPVTFVLRIKRVGSAESAENACSALARYEHESARWPAY